MSKKGGYVIVDLKGQSITAGTPFTLDGVTARLNRAKTKACLLSGFAIGDEEKRDVFVDLQKTEDGYIALFGQYTLTIEDDEVTITDGGVLMDNIVDSQGNKRFVEGDGNPQTVTGYTSKYCKWSLSGTHLMLVAAGSFANSTQLTNGTAIARYSLPDYIKNKIVPVWEQFIESNQIVLHADDWSTQILSAVLTVTNDGLSLSVVGALTLTADRNFRIQCDLLIDSDAE